MNSKYNYTLIFFSVLFVFSVSAQTNDIKPNEKTAKPPRGAFETKIDTVQWKFDTIAKSISSPIAGFTKSLAAIQDEDTIEEPTEKYPFYDALDLAQLMRKSKQNTADSLKIFKILSKYVGSNSPIEPMKLKNKFVSTGNKFLYENFFKPDSIKNKFRYLNLPVNRDLPSSYNWESKIEVGASLEKPSIGKSIGSLDATIFADAFAKIVVKRFKQDLNALFFEQMKADMDKSVELTTVFPNTHQLLQLVDRDIYNFQTYIDGLRQKLEEDFSNVFAGTNALLQTPKYKNIYTKNTTVQSLVSTMFQVSDGLVNKKHPGIIIEQLNLNNDYDKTGEGKKIKAGLQMLQLFSKGLQSRDDTHYWVRGLDSLNMLFKGDTMVGKFWMGLLYQTATDDNKQPLAFSNDVTVRDVINKMYFEPDYYFQSQNLVGTLINQVNQVELTLSDINQSKSNNQNINWTQFVSLFENAVSVIKLAPDFRTVFDPGYVLPPHWNRSLYIAETMPRVYAEMKGKQYHAAVQHIAGLIKAFDFREVYVKAPIRILKIDTIRINNLASNSTIPAFRIEKKIVDVEQIIRVDTSRVFYLPNEKGTMQIQRTFGDITGKFIKLDSNYIPIKKLYLDTAATQELNYNFADAFMKYGGFCASLVESRTSDEVAALLEATMIPPGGTRLKETGTMFGVNGYLGLQHNFQNRDSSSFSSVSAPLGFNFSFGIPRPSPTLLTKSQKFWDIVSPHTIQIFASIVDVGALAGLRFTNNRSDIPKITLENIFSPGLFLQFGRMFKTPLNIGIGYQAQPRLYEINGQNLTLRPFDFRFNLNLNWDIPFWNLWFKAR